MSYKIIPKYGHYEVHVNGKFYGTTERKMTNGSFTEELW